jgi:hypothetical protein
MLLTLPTTLLDARDKPRNINLNQKNIPLFFTHNGLGNWVKDPNPLYVSDYSSNPYQIHYKVNWQNTGYRKITAYEVKFVVYDPWDEIIKNYYGTTIQEIEPKENGTKSFYFRLPTSDIWTIFFFVSKVRFSNDEIINADMNYITSKIEEYQGKTQQSSEILEAIQKEMEKLEQEDIEPKEN